MVQLLALSKTVFLNVIDIPYTSLHASLSKHERGMRLLDYYTYLKTQALVSSSPFLEGGLNVENSRLAKHFTRSRVLLYKLLQDSSTQRLAQQLATA